MQITKEWFDEPGEALEPTQEVEIWLIGKDSQGQMRRRKTVARLRYISERERILAGVEARRWLAKQSKDVNVTFDQIAQTERAFVLAQALGDPEDPAVNLFMSAPGQSPGEVVLASTVYVSAEDVLERWEQFMRKEFPVAVDQPTLDAAKEQAVGES